jgi:tetratricopeptide (TPR) repeat protein
MPDQGEDRISQRVRGGRDVNAAGRDQTIITGRDHMTVTLGAAGTKDPGAPGLLPRDALGFIGRDEELSRLVRLARGGRVAVAVIGGTAGVGKTALVVHAAHQLLPKFPDGHLYADLRGYTQGQDPAEPGEVLQVFLRRLGVAAEEVPAEVGERSGLLRQVLADRRVLMVLDNARTEAQVRPLLPGAGESLVLVTSRSVLAGLEADDRISLDVLPPGEAAAMLAQVVGADRAATDPGAVAEVARLCGRLPLALRIAAQLLAVHPAWPVERLARMLAAEQDRLSQLGAGDLQVRAAFEMSYTQLAAGDARLFRLLGLNPGPDYTTAMAAALADTEIEVAGQVLDRLAEVYLVTENTEGRFGIHDLLRLCALAACRQADPPADREAAESRLVSYHMGLAGFLDSCVDPRQRTAAEQGAERYGVPLPSIRWALARFAAERPGLLATLGLAAQRGWDAQVRQLSQSIMQSLAILRYLDDLVTSLKVALAAARNLGDRADEGRTLTNLGNAYVQLRQFEDAITSYQQDIAICQETGDRHGEGLTLAGLGDAYLGMQRFEEGIDCYQHSLAILQQVGDRYAEGGVLTGLGNAYQGLRRFEEAITAHQQSLGIMREHGDQIGAGITLNNLGIAYSELQRLEEAVACYQQDAAICQETGDRYGEGLTLANLGHAYLKLRQPGRAADCWQEAAAAMRDAGDHEFATRFERQAAVAQSQPQRRWWGLRRRSPA